MGEVVERWGHAFIEITDRCNFDCVFCPSGISERPGQDMGQDLAFDLLDQLQALGFAGIIYFHVLGEPLLHPSVFAIVDRAAEAGMRPVLFTNGGALSHKIVEGVLASKASETVISMQTIVRPAYEMLRKTPFHWDTYLGRIQAALAAAEEAGSGCRFRVSIGIKKADPEHPEDLYFAEYGSPEQVKEGIANIFARVPDADLTGVHSALDAGSTMDLPIFHVTERLSLSVKPMGNWRRIWRDEAVTSGRCPFFGKEIAVLSNGAVTFCHIDYDGRTTIGNAREKPLADMIAAPEFGRMVDDFLAGRSVARGCECCRAVKTRAASGD